MEEGEKGRELMRVMLDGGLDATRKVPKKSFDHHLELLSISIQSQTSKYIVTSRDLGEVKVAFAKAEAADKYPIETEIF